MPAEHPGPGKNQEVVAYWKRLGLFYMVLGVEAPDEEGLKLPRTRFDRDYYGTMGLQADATEDAIRRAYRRLAFEWHPDRNPGNPRAEERFKEISEAYAVLIDPGKRRSYDRARRVGAAGDFNPRREDVFRDLFADPRASAIFEELAREWERLGMRVDRHYFHQTLFGGRTVITGGVFVISPITPVLALFRLARAAIRGATRAPIDATSVRDASRPEVEGRGTHALPSPSSLVGALGSVGRWLLGRPSGTRAPAEGNDVTIPLLLTRLEAERGAQKRVMLNRGDDRDELLVTVPPGVQTGTRLRLRGQGRASADGRRGDAYLEIEIR